MEQVDQWFRKDVHMLLIDRDHNLVPVLVLDRGFSVQKMINMYFVPRILVRK